MYVMLYVLWFVFNQRITLEVAVIGAVVVLLIMFFIKKVYGYNSKDDLKRIFILPQAVAYFFVLLYEILKGSLHMIHLVRDPDGAVSPKLLNLESPLKTTIAKVILANSITLTPGTVTAESKDGRLLVHAIDAHSVIDIQKLPYLKMLMKMEETMHV
jgi:multicomponent Na+:H+ antiporter subunit E